MTNTEVITAMAAYDRKHQRRLGRSGKPTAKYAIGQWLKNTKQQVRDWDDHPIDDEGNVYPRDVVRAIRTLGRVTAGEKYDEAWRKLEIAELDARIENGEAGTGKGDY